MILPSVTWTLIWVVAALPHSGPGELLPSEGAAAQGDSFRHDAGVVDPGISSFSRKLKYPWIGLYHRRRCHRLAGTGQLDLGVRSLFYRHIIFSQQCTQGQISARFEAALFEGNCHFEIGVCVCGYTVSCPVSRECLEPPVLLFTQLREHSLELIFVDFQHGVPEAGSLTAPNGNGKGEAIMLRLGADHDSDAQSRRNWRCIWSGG